MRIPMTERQNLSVARLMRGALCGVTICAAMVFVQVTRAQELPPPSRIGSPTAHVSPTPVARGSTFEVAVDVGIMSGFHMNAHKPSEDYLIPTILTAKLPAGFKELEMTYPPGVPKKLSFTDKPLLVYTGKFTVRAKLATETTAPLGKVKLPFTLQYQACNDAVCLPPVKIPVNVTVQITPGNKTGT